MSNTAPVEKAQSSDASHATMAASSSTSTKRFFGIFDSMKSMCCCVIWSKIAIFDQMTQQQIDFMLSKIPKNRFVLVEELAAMVAWLASEDCAFSTGAVFDISGGRATY